MATTRDKNKANSKESSSQKAQLEAQEVSKRWQRFSHARNSVSEKQRLWNILDMFDRGEQWKNVSTPPWIPKPMTNMIRYVRTLKRANLASAIPMANITSKLEQFDAQVERLSKAYKHVWETERVPRTIRRAVDRAQLNGTSIAFVYSDDNWYGQWYGENDFRNRMYQGEIKVEMFPIANIYPDPDGYRLNKCKFIELTQNLPLRQVQNDPRFKEYAGNKLKNITFETPDQDDSATGDIYNRDIKLSSNGDNVKGDEMVTLHIHLERYYGEDSRWHLDIRYYLANTNFFLLVQEDVKPNEYPLAVLYDEEEENEFFGSSTAMNILENQKIINKTAQTASIIATQHQNPQKVVSRESGINAQELARTGTLPGKVWTANGDPTRAIHVTKPEDIPRGLFDVDAMMKNDIREFAGINEAYTGQSVGSLTTSTGVNSLIERATIRDKDKMVQIDEFVERISHLILLNVLYKWRDQRPITYTGPDGQPVRDTWEPIDDEMIENLDWIIRSDIYAKAPTTQAARRQQADNLMQLQGNFQFDPPIITATEWIQFQDFDMKDQMMKRMQRDQATKEAQRPEILTQQIMQVATAYSQALAQGMSPEQAQQAVAEIAQQIVTEQQQAGVQAARPGQAEQNAQAPRGTTGALAMQNMARGQ